MGLPKILVTLENETINIKDCFKILELYKFRLDRF